MATTTDKVLEGISSLLDTDLYKLTMQCCVLKFFPKVEVTYRFTNRTPHMRFSRAAVQWLKGQISKLEDIRLTDDEYAYLQKTCSYFSAEYLEYLRSFTFNPSDHVVMTFKPDQDTGSDEDIGNLDLDIKGLWVETILYEIPLLALISETYFRFMDTDWSYDGQFENALEKGRKLIEAGCVFSEFGSRRRRDYKAQDIVLNGLLEAAKEGQEKQWSGKLSGTSNVHFAMKHNVQAIGTVAHEWFMGIAAITDDYENANELALRYWVGTFGPGVLGVALTDTFGTKSFLKAFIKDVVPTSDDVSSDGLKGKTYADIFTGVRQDSGDPLDFIKLMKEFYDTKSQIKKTVVFSDSLDVEKCIEFKKASESAGFAPTFGIGTFLTNDFKHLSNGKKSVPLNIVIKLSSGDGKPAVKISDNIGKNTGDPTKVAQVKQRLGYIEKQWEEGDESKRWGTEK